MTSINITTSVRKLTVWLETAQASAKRAINTTKNPDLKAIHEAELREINRTIDELSTGGIQPDLDNKKK